MVPRPTTCQGCMDRREKEGSTSLMCDFHRKKYHQDWRKGNAAKVLLAGRTYRLKLRRAVIDHYSKGTFKCACCGESTPQFLTIDHIDGGGRLQRKSTRNNIHLWIRRNNYPPGFQILCFNCNCGKSVNKNVCPHELTRKTK